MQAVTNCDAKITSTRATAGQSRGRWMKAQGKGRRHAHVSNHVVMDIAAFKVSHSVGSDTDTTAALQAKKWCA